MEVDRLRVVYEAQDQQYAQAMQRMQAQGKQTSQILVDQADRTEAAMRSTGAAAVAQAKALVAAAQDAVSAKRLEASAAKDAADQAKVAYQAAALAVQTASKSEVAAYKEAANEAKRASVIASAAAKEKASEMQRASAAVRAALRAEAAAMEEVQRASSRYRGSIQNVAFQLGDFATQVGAGTSASVALGQQLPQLLGGFGVLGAVLGAVVAVGVPLAASFLRTGEKAADLDKVIQQLNGAIGDYQDAVASAGVPTEELVEKYGRAAGAAQLLLQQLAQLAKLDAASAIRSSASAISDSLGGAVEALNRFEAAQSALAPEDFLNEGTAAAAAMQAQVDKLRDEFGLTVEQAIQLRNILTDQSTAATPEAAADAMRRLSAFLADANLQAGYTNDNLLEAERLAAEGALAGYEFATAMQNAETAAGGVVATVDQLPGAIDAATGSALALTRALSAAIAASQAVPGTIGAPSLGRFGDGSDITRRAGGLDLQEQQNFRYENLRRLAEEEAAAARSGRSGRGGSGRKSGGSKGRAEKAESPFFGDIEKDLLNLERQISLVGKSNEEVATAKARWELLDEAKKRGIPVNEELSAQIDAQAANVGRLTAELERGEKTQQQFETAVDGIADAMAGALVAGESLREGLAQVFKQIASDILNSGIKNAIADQFGGSGGLGILNSIGSFFGAGPKVAGNDALSNSLRGISGFRARGGPVSAGQSYIVGEEGLEVFRPSTSGMIIPNSQIGAGGGNAMTFAPTTSITVQGDASQDTLDAMRRELDARDARMARQIPTIMDNHQKRKG